jgi:hypothetical protein
MFKRLTPQQRDTLRALRRLGEMVVTPDDARPLRALKRRGYVRYRRADGVRMAVLKLNSRETKAIKARTHNVPTQYLHLFWANWQSGKHLRRA